MTRTFLITDDTTTVSIINTSSPGIMLQRGGYQPSSFEPHKLDAAADLDSMLFVDRWTLYLRASSHNNAASQARDLIGLLRKAWKYHNDPSPLREPVYIKETTTGESGDRYSLVYMSPEISVPDYFAPPFDPGNLLEGVSVSVARFAWQDSKPGTIPSSPITLEESTVGGEASPTIVPIQNTHEDLGLISHIYRYDASGPSFSSNLAGTSAFDYFPNPPAVGDILYIGNTNHPFRNVVLKIGTRADWSLTLDWEYYTTGASWASFTLGEDIFPIKTYPDIFSNTGEAMLGMHVEDWDQTTINGVNAWWIRCRVTAYTSRTTVPANADYAPYIQMANWVEIPDTSLKGDIPPVAMLQVWCPHNTETGNPVPGSISRILVGARSEDIAYMDDFSPVINLVSTSPINSWTYTALTDATNTSATDSLEGSRYQYTDVDFSTEEGMESRVRMLHVNGVAGHRGEYLVFIRCEQNGGAVGDCSLQLRTRTRYPSDLNPFVDSDIVPLAGYDNVAEIVPMGKIRIPFADVPANLVFTEAVDLIFEVRASRESGSAATLRLYDIILIPADEWVCEYSDPKWDTITGNTALRPYSGLIDDGGILLDRCYKAIMSSTTTGFSYTDWFPVVYWKRGGKAPSLDPKKGMVRLCFLLMHLPVSAWSDDRPLIAEWGMCAFVRVYTQNRYLSLRGSG